MNAKYAVCIGINYPGTDAQLNGCVNDARDWGELLRSQGYRALEVHDSEATRDRILGELEWMVDHATWGDRIVFTFSGHGTWVPDVDFDELDRRDEAICPIDYATNGTILDDEIQRIFAKTRFGVGSLILSDSCHSGTVSRVAMTGVVDPGRPKFLPPSSFLPITAEREMTMEAISAPNQPRQTTSLISGCADPEYSYDAWFNGKANGAFTRVAIDSFRSGIGLNDWFQAIRRILPNDGYPQSPQFTWSNMYRKYARAL